MSASYRGSPLQEARLLLLFPQLHRRERNAESHYLRRPSLHSDDIHVYKGVGMGEREGRTVKFVDGCEVVGRVIKYRRVLVGFNSHPQGFR